MRKLLFAFGLIFSTSAAIAADNYLATQGSGTTFAAKDGGAGLLFPRVIGCDNTTTTQCWTIDSSGRLSALTNPATPANWGIGTSTQNSASVANGVLQLGQFNTAPTTITTGNMSPIQLDSAGNLLVNVKAGGAGGGAATVADGADVAEGAKADSAWVSGSGSVIAILKNVAAGIAASIPAGTNIMGKVGIDQTTDGTTNGVRLTNAYPSGATPITASATGTTTATTATLAGTSGKTTYICGYSIRANATAAATVTNTITGVITATLSSIMWVAPLASGIGVDEQIFSPCIPASATNTGIAIVSGAPGSGGTVSSRGWGYQQ